MALMRMGLFVLALALALASAGGLGALAATPATGAYVFELNRTELGCAGRQLPIGGRKLALVSSVFAAPQRPCSCMPRPRALSPSPACRWAMQLELGTPAQTVSAMIDTGSGLVWMPVMGCGAACSKGLASDAGFDAAASATFAPVACDAPACSTGYCEDCSCSGSPAPGEGGAANNTCGFDLSYFEGAQSFGDLVQDQLELPRLLDSSQGNASLVFGLQQGATGALLQQSVPALIGAHACWAAAEFKPALRRPGCAHPTNACKPDASTNPPTHRAGR